MSDEPILQVDDRLRLPAEFEPHRCTYLLWPTRPDNWRDRASYAQASIARLANLIAQYEPVTLGFPKGSPSPVLSYRFGPEVSFFEAEYDDIWIRDTGPVVITTADRSLAIDFRFNSWGGLFSHSTADDALAQTVAEILGIPSIRTSLVLEGGALLTDGNETMILTEESVLSENRNADLSRVDVDLLLRQLLRARQVIWLPSGLADDEAGGHIDNVCTFANPRLLLVSDTDDRNHPSFERLKEAQSILRKATNANGDSYELTLLPLPPQTSITQEEASGFAVPEGTIQRAAGTPLAPSYTNLYIANGAVIVPTYGVSTDEQALEIISRAFPDCAIIAFDSRELLLGGGAVHCVTRDIPMTANTQRGIV